MMQNRLIVGVRSYGMMGRHHRRHAKRARRHDQALSPVAPGGSSPPPRPMDPPRVGVREADHVVQLAYTGSQAAEALGISRSTLRRLLPYLETIELPWGGKLIPAD